MDTEGIIVTVGTILLFAAIAILVVWLNKKGILKPHNCPRSMMDDPWDPNGGWRLREKHERLKNF
jgi:hypothetical protein